jgi:hydroxymethylpyrimidine/phosphomethylpyrimidine kinase
LKKYGAKNIVLDPVMVAQSGDKLLQDEAVAAIREYLMPIADVATPNLPEAQVLLNRELHGAEDMKDAARSLSQHGSKSILVKGGHLKDSQIVDVLYLTQEKRFVSLKSERIETRNNHGTGCTLSSAVAAFLAKGDNIETAVTKAKDYITKAIQAGAAYRLGQGHGPVHHFFAFWE